MKLSWDIFKEYGFVDITPREYDEAYFKKYVGYAGTPMGVLLTESRIKFIEKWHSGRLLDVGAGAGQFVKAREDTFGYDINPYTVRELKEAGKYMDINDHVFLAYSFFDSFEHIKDHSELLRLMDAKTKVFISIPIFRDMSHILRSKHFRLTEHYWYFTPHGLIRYMADFGFSCLDVDNFEIRAGREDIWSFAFEKRCFHFLRRK